MKQALLTIALAAITAIGMHSAVRAQVTSPTVTAEVTSVPDADRRAVLAQQQRIAGLSEAQAVLQKEIDSAIAEYTRTIQRLQAAAPAGTELTPQLTYAKKSEPPKASDKKQ